MDTVAQLHEKLLAMNEALLLGSLRQNELTQAAEELNVQLRAKITQHSLTEEILRRRTAQFETLLDEAPLGVYVVDADLRFCQANPIAFSVFGHIPGFIGQDFNEVVHILWPTAYADEIVERFRHTLESGEPYLVPERIETRLDRGTVESYEWQISRIPLPDGRYGVVCYFRDISERVQYQQQIRESEAFSRGIIKSSPDCIKVLDLEGNLLSMESGQELLGIEDIQPFLNKSWIEFWQGEHHQAAQAAIALAVAGKAGKFNGFFRTFRGEPKWWDVAISPILDLNHKPERLLAVSRDVTERKRGELELSEALAVANKANQAKSEFLSHMSHELRTPLNAVLGFAQLLEAGAAPLSLSQKRSVEQIVKAGWYLLDLINEILDLALIESGKLALCMESVSLADVMRECAGLTEPQAQARDIRVTFPLFDGACFIQADHTRVKQVIVNLLSNAIKYNRAGGTVAVDYTADAEGHVRVNIADTGAGLTAEQLAQLFQPFNRLGQEQSAEEGTGIGLVLSKRLVELMGGVIGVDSTVGKGSLFWIELNLTPDAQTPAGAAGATTGLPAAPAQPHADAPLRTLLYVEDNLANLMLVEDIIARRPDIHLLSAMDGLRGLAIARASLPDVILLDINLPGMNGMRVLEALAADIVTAHIPVIAISAKAMPRDIDNGLTAGCFRYLAKPINITAFMDALDAAFHYATNHATRVNVKE